jgi:hypothetical protein
MRKHLFILISLLVLCLFGCPTSSSTTDPVVGTFNLTSATINAAPTALSVLGFTSFTLTVDNNQTWSGVQVPFPVAAPANVSGTWSVSGSTYTIAQTSPSALSMGTATLSGSTMTQTIPNNPNPGDTLVLIWTKQ